MRSYPQIRVLHPILRGCLPENANRRKSLPILHPRCPIVVLFLFQYKKRMTAGQEQPDDGQVSVDPGMTIGYFSQDVGEMSGQSAVAAVMDGVGPVRALAVEIAQLEAAMADRNGG